MRLIDWGQRETGGERWGTAVSAQAALEDAPPPNPITHVVSLALRANLATKSNGGALALDGLSVGVNVGDGDLDRSVVLGRDEAVWG